MNAVKALDAVLLPPLMDHTSGNPKIKVRLIEGPVLTSHRELAADNIHVI